jgi:hypothetical protein
MKYIFWPIIVIQILGFLWGIVTGGVQPFTVKQICLLFLATIAFVVSYRASKSPNNTIYRGLSSRRVSKEAQVEIAFLLIGFVFAVWAASFYVLSFFSSLVS